MSTQKPWSQPPQPLQPLSLDGWRSGFANLFARELSAWFGTRRWWVQALIWTGLITGTVTFLGLFLPMMPDEAVNTREAMLQIYFALAMVAVAIGVVLSTQDAIIGERQMGTAAWILSKPVSRTAFVAAKFAGAAAGYLLSGVVLPAVTSYLVMRLMGHAVPLLPFLGGVGLVGLHMLFYLALTLMLGTAVTTRSAVTGAGLAFLLGGQAIGSIVAPLALLFPWKFVDIAAALVLGQPLPLLLFLPVALAPVWVAVLVAWAVRRFEQAEL